MADTTQSIVQALLEQGGGNQGADNNNLALLLALSGGQDIQQLMTAPRTDPYGNTLSYIEGEGFGYDVTGLTQALLNAEQIETLRNLEQDAPRNRELFNARANRAINAGDALNDTLSKFTTAPVVRDDTFIAEEQQAGLRARKRGLDEATATLSRALIRAGGGSGLNELYNNMGEQYAGSLEDTLYQGRKRGRAEAKTIRDGEANALMRELSTLGGIANSAGQAQIKPSNVGKNDNVNQSIAMLAQFLQGQNQLMSSGVKGSGLSIEDVNAVRNNL